MTYSDSQNKSYQMAFIFAALIGESPEYAWVTRKYSKRIIYNCSFVDSKRLIGSFRYWLKLMY